MHSAARLPIFFHLIVLKVVLGNEEGRTTTILTEATNTSTTTTITSSEVVNTSSFSDSNTGGYSAPPIGCDGEFYSDGNTTKCFWISDPLVSLNFSHATNQCNNKGGTLATIDNIDQNKFVKRYILYHDTSQLLWIDIPCSDATTWPSMFTVVGGKKNYEVPCYTGLNQTCYKIAPFGNEFEQINVSECMQEYTRTLCEIPVDPYGCVGKLYFNRTTVKCLWIIRGFHQFSDGIDYCNVHNGVLGAVFEDDEFSFIAKYLPRPYFPPLLWVGMHCNAPNIWTSLSGEIMKWNKPCPSPDPQMSCYQMKMWSDQKILPTVCTDGAPILCESRVDVCSLSQQPETTEQQPYMSATDTGPTDTTAYLTVGAATREQSTFTLTNQDTLTVTETKTQSCMNASVVTVTVYTPTVYRSSLTETTSSGVITFKTKTSETVIETAAISTTDHSSIPESTTILVTPTCTDAAGNDTENKWKKPLTPDELKEKIEEIEHNLRLRKTELSSTKRKRQSAANQRQSSKSIGFCGLFILLFIIFSRVIFDLPRFYNDFKNGPKNVDGKHPNDRKTHLNSSVHNRSGTGEAGTSQ